MNGNRTPSANRPPRPQFSAPRAHSTPPPPLDRERAVAELKRFLELAVREMGLDICEFDSRRRPAGDEAEVAVTFSGADQELLLETKRGVAAGARAHRASLAAARSAAARSRAVRLRRLSRHAARGTEAFGARRRAARARNRPAVSIQSDVVARTPHRPSRTERRARRAHRKRRLRRPPPAGDLPRPRKKRLVPPRLPTAETDRLARFPSSCSPLCRR